VRRGEIWWADLPQPPGSGPGHVRPVVVVQADSFNESRIQTVIVAAVTTNLNLEKAPGNLMLRARDSGLPRDSVVNVSQLLTIDRSLLRDFVGRVPARKMGELDRGLRTVLEL
jgi:mRNA interferase MazF